MTFLPTLEINVAVSEKNAITINKILKTKDFKILDLKKSHD